LTPYHHLHSSFDIVSSPSQQHPHLQCGAVQVHVRARSTSYIAVSPSVSAIQSTMIPFDAIRMHMQSLEVATTKVSRGRALSDSGGQPALPPVTLRPGALWRLVRASTTTIWMVSAGGHPWAVGLEHAGFRCRAMAIGGNLKGARRAAAASLHPRHHDGLAKFLSAFGSDGAAEALLLPGAPTSLVAVCVAPCIDWRGSYTGAPWCVEALLTLATRHDQTRTVCSGSIVVCAGLSLELELALAVKCGALTRGVACLSALLAGCRDRTLLAKFAAWRARDVDPDAELKQPSEGEGSGEVAGGDIGRGDDFGKKEGKAKEGGVLPGEITSKNTNVREPSFPCRRKIVLWRRLCASRQSS
jgi:hypothetical protein